MRNCSLTTHSYLHQVPNPLNKALCVFFTPTVNGQEPQSFSIVGVEFWAGGVDGEGFRVGIRGIGEEWGFTISVM